MSTTNVVDLQIGSLLAGRYRLVSRLYSGPHSLVFRAVDEWLGREVAVKTLSPDKAGDEEALDRFRREALAAARVHHPSVAALFDRHDDPTSSFLVSELVEGSSLADHIRERGPLAPKRAVAIARQVLAGLAACHAAGVVHRDIKASNVLLGRDGAVKIVDFGIAQLEGFAPITQFGFAVGTPAYASPEQASGEPAGPAADLYSVGVLLYEMLAGRPPFAGSDAEVLAQHVRSSPPRLRALVPGVPSELERVVEKALSKRAADRWQSAQEMARTLERCEELAAQTTEVGLRAAPRAESQASAEAAPAPRLDRRAPLLSPRMLGRAGFAFEVAAVLVASVLALAIVGYGAGALIDAFGAVGRIEPSWRLYASACAFGALVGLGSVVARGARPSLFPRDARGVFLTSTPSLLAQGYLAASGSPVALAPAVVRGHEGVYYAVAAAIALAVSIGSLYTRRLLTLLVGLAWTLAWLAGWIAVSAAAGAVGWGLAYLIDALAAPAGGLTAGKLVLDGALLGLLIGLAPIAAERLVRRGWAVRERTTLAGSLGALALCGLGALSPLRQILGISLEGDGLILFAAAAGAAGVAALLRAIFSRP